MRRILTWMIVLTMLFSFLPSRAFAAGGSCGDNVFWSFDSQSGTLSIYGTGKMEDYTSSAIPWSSYKNSIRSAVIGEGVTDLCDYAFWQCGNLTSVSIANTVDTIGQYALGKCTSLKSVTLPDSVEWVSYSAFQGSSALEEITFGTGLVWISQGAFYGCESLKTVRVTSVKQWLDLYLEFTVFGVPVGMPELETTPLYYNADLYVRDEKLTELVVPEGYKSIPIYQFYGCNSLTSVILPYSMENLAHHALYAPNLTEAIVMNPDCTFNYYSLYGKSAIIHGAAGSTAQTYASSVSLPFHACEFIDNGDGTHDYYCTVCEESKVSRQRHIDGLCPCGFSSVCQHEYETTVKTEATCTKDGQEISACTLCGDSYTSVIPALGHSYDAEITAPTCTEGGFTTYTCAVCGDSYTANRTNAKGHSYRAAVTVPTCTEGGFTTYTCTVCGYSIVANETAAAGHRVEIIEGIDATCTEEGLSDGAYCSVCGETLIEQELTKPLGHNYEAYVLAPSCTEGGYTTYVCSHCADSYVAEPTEATGHSFGAWLVQGDIEERVCKACGTTEQRSVNNPFTDIAKNDYFYAPVLWAVSGGITNGYSDNEFAPNEPCTRAQIVTFLWRAAGSPRHILAGNPFEDVPESAYYADAVLWAVENGITNGMSETTFEPDAVCTRGQAVTFLYRAYGAPSASENPFTDVPDDAYYCDAVLWAVENGITMGIGGGKFSPESTCTRAQIVTFLYRALT